MAAVMNGFMRQQIDMESYRTAVEEASGERVVIGVNKFLSEEQDRKPVLHRPDPDVLRKQLDRLDQVKRERDGRAVRESLARLTEAARGDENLMPYIIDAVKTYATISETMGALRDVFGVFREQASF